MLMIEIIGTLAQLTALFALQHAEAFAAQIDMLRSLRQSLCKELSVFEDLTVYPSDTNFILLRIGGDGPAVHKGLRSKGVLVKNLHGAHPFLENCIRVSIGTAEENAAFLHALRETFT